VTDAARSDFSHWGPSTISQQHHHSSHCKLTCLIAFAHITGNFRASSGRLSLQTESFTTATADFYQTIVDQLTLPNNMPA